MELVEVIYTLKDMLDAAQRILDQTIIQKNGIGVFAELGFGYAAGMRMYVTDEPLRLAQIVHKIERDGKTYFLGCVK